MMGRRVATLPDHAIFTLGACTDTTETDWNYLLSNNVKFAQTIWTWCVETACPFYYASSEATYGGGSRGFDDRTPPGELEPPAESYRSVANSTNFAWTRPATLAISPLADCDRSALELISTLACHQSHA